MPVQMVHITYFAREREMGRAKVVMVAMGAALLVGTLAAPANAGLSLYSGSDGGGSSRYYEISDCDYGNNNFTDGTSMANRVGSAYSHPGSTSTFYIYGSASDSRCTGRTGTGYLAALHPGEGYSASIRGHYKS